MSKPQILCFLDLETTGHDPLKRVESDRERYLIPWHEIIDIGCIFVTSDNLEEVGRFNTLVHPKHPERCIPDLINNYPERAERGEWDEAVDLETALKLLFAVCSRYSEEVVVPGGQNWFFDWSFLTVAFAWHGIEESDWNSYLHYKRFDTASMAMQAMQEIDKPVDMSDFSLRSGKLQEELGIDPEPEPHRAINGASQALEVFRKLRWW